ELKQSNVGRRIKHRLAPGQARRERAERMNVLSSERVSDASCIGGKSRRDAKGVFAVLKLNLQELGAARKSPTSCESSDGLPLCRAILYVCIGANQHIAVALRQDDAQIIHGLATVVARMYHVAMLLLRNAVIKSVADLLFAKQTSVRDVRKTLFMAPAWRNR